MLHWRTMNCGIPGGLRRFLSAFVALIHLAAVVTNGAAGSNDAGGEIQGRIVCLDSTGDSVVECTDASTRFALRTAEGRLFRLLETDPIAEMFVDPRVRDRELRIRVWHRDDDRVEIVKVYSIRDGRLHDLYYYCDVCHITSFVGGPCWCCQMDFEFREEPVP